MKALSVKQPWANMIARGEKTIETRTWPTKYRGELLICSSKKPNIEPAGCAVAIVNLVDCRPMAKDDEAAACVEMFDGAWAWVLELTGVFGPFPVKGRLGIFDLDVEIE